MFMTVKAEHPTENAVRLPYRWNTLAGSVLCCTAAGMLPTLVCTARLPRAVMLADVFNSALLSFCLAAGFLLVLLLNRRPTSRSVFRQYLLADFIGLCAGGSAGILSMSFFYHSVGKPREALLILPLAVFYGISWLHLLYALRRSGYVRKIGGLIALFLIGRLSCLLLLQLQFTLKELALTSFLLLLQGMLFVIAWAAPLYPILAFPPLTSRNWAARCRQLIVYSALLISGAIVLWDLTFRYLSYCL